MWLTYIDTEEFSQVASVWRSVKQNHACSALDVHLKISGWRYTGACTVCYRTYWGLLYAVIENPNHQQDQTSIMTTVEQCFYLYLVTATLSSLPTSQRHRSPIQDWRESADWRPRVRVLQPQRSAIGASLGFPGGWKLGHTMLDMAILSCYI